MVNNTKPIGINIGEHIGRKLDRSKPYREAHERTEPFEQIARIAIVRRAQLGLSQKQVAERMGVAISTVARIEKGQRRTPVRTIHRLQEALEIPFYLDVKKYNLRNSH